MQQMQVVVPPGVHSGQQLHVQTPAGPMMVVVPPGVHSGGTFIVQVPAPTAQATPVGSAYPPVQPLMAPPQPAPQPPGQPYPGMYPSSAPQPQYSENSASSPTDQHNTPLLSSVSPPPEFDVPMGTPVGEAMPQLPSANTLSDKYTGYQYTTEEPDEAGNHHAASYDAKSGISDASASLPMGTPVAYYTDEQLAVLNQQPVPADMFSAGIKSGGAPAVGQPLPSVGLPVAQDAAVAVAQPVLTTASGVPVVNTAISGLSAAKTQYDGWGGIKSCDKRLQDSVDELMLFFNSHNSRPLVGCQVEGWHHERRTRRRRVERDGKTHWETEHYVVKVTDFQYKVDLTPFVYPYGYIASVDEKHLNVPQLCEKFVNDTNLLKSLAMKKEVHFDFRALHAMVFGYVRSLGWRRGLTVSFPKANNNVRVYHENWLSQMWENCCVNVLCHVTILPCILMRLYRGDCCWQEDHAEEDIRSFFRIHYAPIQVFEAIRPMLWCPGFSGARMAMEVLRNVFW